MQETREGRPKGVFRWYEPIYYYGPEFPSGSRERRGRFLGIAEPVGHHMTFKILTDDTQKVIHRSTIRSTLYPQDRNPATPNCTALRKEDLYVDANLYHDFLTGRSVTGTLDLLNCNPIDWYCKKQATVEPAAYESEFNATRTCTDRSIAMRNTLRYLGIPVRKATYMSDDNKSVVDSASNQPS